jgi:hypothetical protein
VACTSYERASNGSTRDPIRPEPPVTTQRLM